MNNFLQGTEENPIGAGIGYVIIPSNIERREYLQSVFKNNAVMLRNEDGNKFVNVSVDNNVLQRLKFPKDYDGFGSTVVFVNIPKYNNKIVIGVLDVLSDAASIINEFQTKIEEISDDSLVAATFDASNSEINVSVSGFKTGIKSKLNFTINNPDNNAEMNVYVNGNATIKATDTVKLVANNILQFSVADSKSKTLFDFKYKKNSGLTIIDEFGNEVNMNNDLLSLFSNASAKLITMNDSFLEIGTKDKAKELSVLGETLKTLMEELFDILSNAKINTVIGPQPFLPTTQIKLSNLKNRLKTILSKSVKLD